MDMEIDANYLYITYYVSATYGVIAWYNSTNLTWSFVYPSSVNMNPHTLTILSNGDVVEIIVVSSYNRFV